MIAGLGVLLRIHPAFDGSIVVGKDGRRHRDMQGLGGYRGR